MHATPCSTRFLSYSNGYDRADNCNCEITFAREEFAGAVTGGFLAELGFKIGEKAVTEFFSEKAEGLSERIAKLRTKSYQANVYDFKKKYKI
jgi:hypothetical protein